MNILPIPVKKILIVLIAIFIGILPNLFAQPKVVGNADKIIAVVGKDRIVLKSELETNFEQAQKADPSITEEMKGSILQQLVFQKLLANQAELDSLLVSDEEVEAAIDNKLRYYIRQYGFQERLEEVTGKTVYQLKDENKEVMREMLMAEKMQQQIMENIKITPAEVQHFYDQVPKDSLPFYPAIVEIGQIVIDPPVSEEMDDYAKKKLQDIRKEIVTEGKSFETMAGIYSDDPGSRNNGGRYNNVTRNGGWAPEFVAAAFKLQNGEISPIVKTQFGYHIIQMIQRKGEQVDLRHILVRPQKTSIDFEMAMKKLDSIRTLLVAGKYGFSEAVGKFSTDEAAKQTGGMILNPQTGQSEIEIASLDPQMVLILDTLQPGSYSSPQVFINDRGDQSTRIVYLKSRTEPHKANLQDDYSKIQQVALSQKKAIHLQGWVKNSMKDAYISIDKEYKNNKAFEGWNLAEE